MKNILITGANRGIGLELSRSFAKHEDTRVFAACRKPDGANELKSLVDDEDYNLEIVKLDVSDQESINSCAAEIGGRAESLFALINNAGTHGGTVPNPQPETFYLGQLDMEEMLGIFRVNTVGPIIMAQATVDLLERSGSARIINVSSDAGSITYRKGGNNHTYPASKAALNMITRSLSAELKSKGIIVVSVHPGFLRTDMGGPNAPLSTDDTVPHLVELIEGLTMDNSGEFLNWDGKEVPW